MKSRMLKCLALSALLLSPFAASAQKGARLKVGDPAPPLTVGKWLKGEPVEKLEAGKMYVVEFWATWCGPCVQAIPHVTKLQKQYPDLVFIGVDVWENAPDKVAKFVEKMGDKMDYRVALDDLPEGKKEGKMAAAWLEAAGQNGIPCSMVVGKDGKLAWIGHPMGLDPVLKKLAGEKAGEKPADKDAAAVKEEPVKKEEPAKKEDPAEDAEAKQERIQEMLQQALDGVESPEDALAALEKLGKESPEALPVTQMFRFNILLGHLEDQEAAYKVAAQILETGKDNPDVLNELSWTILTEVELHKRDLPLALKIAEQAVKVSGGKRADVLDTLARAHFEIGRAKAIEFQAKAVKAAEAMEGEDAEDMRETVQAVLEVYETFDPHAEVDDLDGEDVEGEMEEEGDGGVEDPFDSDAPGSVG